MSNWRGIARLFCLFGLFAAAAAVAGPGHPPVAHTPVAPDAAQAHPGPSPSAAVQAILDEQTQIIATLRERLVAADGPEEAIAIQREIEREKSRGEIRLLGLQLEFARAAGDEETAIRLQVAIERLQAHVDRLHPSPPEPTASGADGR